jgi:chromosomal replication initiator protein
MHDADELWNQCARSIRAQVSDVVWQTTFTGVAPLNITSNRLNLSVPSTIVKERIEGRFLALVRDALADVGAPELDLGFVVEKPAPSEPEELPFAAIQNNGDARDGSDNGDHPQVPQGHGEIFRESPLARYTFDTFVIGGSNRFAHAAALRVAERPAHNYNPLFIYGDAGLGKTHLLQAIRKYVNEHYPSYTVRYVSTEALMNQFVDAIRMGTMPDFKRRYREIDVLLVDDIQFIEGKEGLQEEFFHTFNTLQLANRQIVISSDRPPDSIPTLEDRLRSRFKMGLIVDIQPPDVETRLAILRKKADSDAHDIGGDVLTFIAEHVVDNIRELEGALNRVTAFANLTRQVLTVEMARQVLADLLSTPQPRPITPGLILQKTSDMFGFSIEEIKGASRRRPLVTARQVAMFVFRDQTDLSYPAIAREFGGRDHTTVIHAVEKINSQMRERRQIYEQVTELIQNLKSGD